MESVEREIADTFGYLLDVNCLRGVVHLVAKALKEDVCVGMMDYRQCIEWLGARGEAAFDRMRKLVMVDRGGKMYGHAETLCRCAEYAYVKYE